MTTTRRSAQKASRRAALMQSAARLFAERGYQSVSTVELGEAVGMSGPALYNYFPSKEAILRELLVGASSRLLAGGLEIVAEGQDPDEQYASEGGIPADRVLRNLIAFHVDFAVNEPDVILLQSQELRSLPQEENARVRRLQREYVREWQRVLRRVVSGLDDAEAETRVRAVFGLLNSTPHSVRSGDEPAAQILASMAFAALTVPV